MKLYKHLGFLIEAFCEAFPQSILQLTAIVYYNEPSTISILSILLSLSSVCGKVSLMVVTGDWRGWKMRIMFWLCFVVDFFSIFFIVSFSFYRPENENWQMYFTTIRDLCLWQFIICVIPFVLIGSIGIHLYWTVRVTKGIYCWCCLPVTIGISLLWILCLFATLLMLQISNTWWVGYILWMMTSPRIPYQHTAEQFYIYLIDWILETKNERQQIIKLCIVNDKILTKKDESGWGHSYVDRAEFHKYLQSKSDDKYQSVTFKSLRENAKITGFKYNGDKQYVRDPRFFVAAYYEGYYSVLRDWKNTYKTTNNWQNLIALLTVRWLTYISGPLYLMGRLMILLTPLIVLIYLSINGINLFGDVAVFQIAMWCIYTGLLTIWSVLLYTILKEEYVIWHIIPNTTKLAAPSVSEKLDIVTKDIKDAYEEMLLIPIVQKMITNLLGDDISQLVMFYFKSIELISKP